ncbi:hypothetical protein BUE76_19195 [Cnuella takakiae]|nr:hypothetical protein BUE76_19195 [Cnuella takakiae]
MAAYRKNLVKINVGSLLLFQNYNLTIERALTRKISASVGYRSLPRTEVSKMNAFKKVYDLTGSDAAGLEEDWGGTMASSKAYTAEIRFYGGRKPGPRGFYLGLYGRYASFDVDYNYNYETNTTNYNIPISATAKGIGGGLYIGVQWLIAKRVALDWQILGGHWGKLTGNGAGLANLSGLSTDEQQDIQYDLEELIPTIGNKNPVAATVNNTGVQLKLDGPFAGLRSGISLGIAF